MALKFRKTYRTNTKTGRREVTGTVRTSSTGKQTYIQKRNTQPTRRSGNFLQSLFAPLIKKKGDAMYQDTMKSMGGVYDKSSNSYKLTLPENKNSLLSNVSVTVGQPVYGKKVDFDDTPYNLGMPDSNVYDRVRRRNKMNVNTMGQQEDMMRGFYSGNMPSTKPPQNILSNLSSLFSMGKR